MGKSISVVVVLMLLTVSAHAQTPTRKLGRGLSNVVTSPMEILSGMQRASEEKGLFAGLTWGTVDGLFHTVKRAVVGVYETATFPVPVPAGYEPILDDPEFFMQDSLRL